jgi:hypothetical protein
VCADAEKSRELLTTKFYQNCNLYLPDSLRGESQWPREVRVFAGEFPVDVERKSEAISLHIAGSISDIVLLYGWRLDSETWASRGEFYRGFVRHTLENSSVQWVIVDHATEIVSEISELENVSTDSLSSVVQLMKI